MKERIHWIDIAKGIAIICVFLGHTVSSPSEIGNFVYSFHMPLFFLLSGYCFSSRRKFGDFVLTKLKTIVLPIFSLGLTGAIVVAVLSYFLKHENIDWKWLFLNPFVQYKEHSLLWYLAALFVALIIFYAITKLFKDKPLPIIISAFVLGGISYTAIRLFDYDLPWNVPTALIALPFIAIGYTMKKKDFSKNLNHIWVPIASFLGCLISGYCNLKFFGGVEMHSNSYGNIALFYLTALLGSIMVISFSVLLEKNSMLEYFGKNSLIFYALEPIQYFVNFTLKVFHPYFSESKIYAYAFTIVAIVIICLMSSIASFIINKYLPFLIGKSNKKARYE